jgi:hypothetical protein
LNRDHRFRDSGNTHSCTPTTTLQGASTKRRRGKSTRTKAHSAGARSTIPKVIPTLRSTIWRNPKGCTALKKRKDQKTVIRVSKLGPSNQAAPNRTPATSCSGSQDVACSLGAMPSPRPRSAYPRAYRMAARSKLQSRYHSVSASLQAHSTPSRLPRNAGSCGDHFKSPSPIRAFKNCLIAPPWTRCGTRAPRRKPRTQWSPPRLRRSRRSLTPTRTHAGRPAMGRQAPP